MSRAESAARPHGAMPQKLRDYWTKGPGAAKIGWGAGGDFNRCLLNLAPYVKTAALKGLCSNLHEIATGMSTTTHAELLGGPHRHHK